MPVCRAFACEPSWHQTPHLSPALVGVRLPTGHALSVVLYIDHNLGTVAKDGFVVADPLAEFIAFMRSKNDDPDMLWTDVDPSGCTSAD